MDRITCFFDEKQWGSETIRWIAELSTLEFSLIYNWVDCETLQTLDYEQLLAAADKEWAGLYYADYSRAEGEHSTTCEVIDYQKGSLRDDFNFGPLLLFRSDILRKVVASMTDDYRFAGLYDLRLKVSEIAPVVHIKETLCRLGTTADRQGKTQFDYVDPRNRAVQEEMEKACTNHLKHIGAYLEPSFRKADFESEAFGLEASVIIPVRNRESTIEDAIRSALNQKTTFPYNVIIIDNHSTDGTTEKIRRFASDSRLVHIIPEKKDLKIGGCWNEGVRHPKCGKFAVQLDSDDVYSADDTLQKIVDAFYEQQCPMIVGTYKLTNFDLETIPPGIIDHREWTPENGRNNALRINGLGAPRAFYTPLVRELGLPDVSYGEDYAIGLRISREYQIGRLYDVLYFCRRWEGNSDASPDMYLANSHNTYKDSLRTGELEARIKLNQNRQVHD